MIQETKEDYLRTIYFIYENKKNKSEGINSSDIAKELEITKPTVSRIVKKLSEEKYITFERYSKIHFTKKGLREARKIMYKHRVIEVFLTKSLGYEDTKKIHNEAHDLEHSFSEESVKRIDKLLGYPKKTKTGREVPREATE